MALMLRTKWGDIEDNMPKDFGLDLSILKEKIFDYLIIYHIKPKTTTREFELITKEKSIVISAVEEFKAIFERADYEDYDKFNQRIGRWIKSIETYKHELDSQIRGSFDSISPHVKVLELKEMLKVAIIDFIFGSLERAQEKYKLFLEYSKDKTKISIKDFIFDEMIKATRFLGEETRYEVEKLKPIIRHSLSGERKNIASTEESEEGDVDIESMFKESEESEQEISQNEQIESILNQGEGGENEKE